jgi:hypothetical protein
MQTGPSFQAANQFPHTRAETHQRDLQAALPLYAASLLVTLAGVGAVGVTVSNTMFTPVWATLAIVGHVLSLLLRRARVPMETLFYPVMVLGAAVVVQLLLAGSPLVGMDAPLAGMDLAMGTATLVGALAVLRTFTLLTDSSLIFSPVPGITMLALVGSTNPNAEVPIFFGLLVLGALFLTGYEAHLRRIRRTGRKASPLVLHLLTAWSATLGVALLALLFPLLLQPILGPLSPFSLPAVNRLQNLVNFAQSSSSKQAAVGAGPINLSPTPIYNVYSRQGGLLRTEVLTRYTGRSWTAGMMVENEQLESREISKLREPLPAGDQINYSQPFYRFEFPRDPDLQPGVPTQTVHQTIETLGMVRDGVPAFGRIRELVYPRKRVNLQTNGAVSGAGHLGVGRVFQVVSEIPQHSPEALRSAPPVDPIEFPEPETLELPNSTLRVQNLARSITRNARTPYDKVSAIMEYLEKTCTYTLQEEPTPPGEDAAEYYLFETKRGACGLASTAVAVMCRAVGVPARVAMGYVAEEPLENAPGWRIRQEHGHMWVEAFFPGHGWVDFNPAPPFSSIRDNPLQIAWYRLTGLLRNVGGGGLDAVLLLTALFSTAGLVGYAGWKQVGAWTARRNRKRRLEEDSPGAAVTFVYAEALRHLGRRGWERQTAETPTEFLERLRGEWAKLPLPAGETAGAALAAFEQLTDYYEQARYAGQGSAELLREATAAALELRRVAPLSPEPRKRSPWFKFRLSAAKRQAG